MSAVIRRPCLPCGQRNTSSRVPWLQRHVPAFLATPDPSATVSPSTAFPVVAGYTAYLAPAVSRWDEDGFSSCLARPGHRAVAPTPPEWPVAPASLRRVMRPSPSGCGLGLRGDSLSGPPLRSLSLRPGDSLAIPQMALSMGFRGWVSRSPTIQATGRLALTPVGLPPTERASLCWTHIRT